MNGIKKLGIKMSQLIGCFLVCAINSHYLAVIIDHPVVKDSLRKHSNSNYSKILSSDEADV